MRTIIAIFCFSLILAGCSAAPYQAGFPATLEPNLQSVEHWRFLARDVVEKQVIPAGIQAVYVCHGKRTPFDKAFRTFLVTELVNHGIDVLKTRENCPTIKWTTQVVYNDKPCWQWPGIVPGAFMLAADAVAGTGAWVPCPPAAEVILAVKAGDSRQTYDCYLEDGNAANFQTVRVQPVVNRAWVRNPNQDIIDMNDYAY
ncbi:MAG: hypothetical protein M0Z81_06530 [Deltaproteobacteria bacterium]|jgi:hypothetical protein|nr:hypothetical protein [Deltaproteobacteria bacterium]